MSVPSSGTPCGASSPPTIVTTIGRSTRAARETSTLFTGGITRRRSSFVVRSRMIGGCTTGTSDM